MWTNRTLPARSWRRRPLQRPLPHLQAAAAASSPTAGSGPAIAGLPGRRWGRNQKWLKRNQPRWTDAALCSRDWLKSLTAQAGVFGSAHHQRCQANNSEATSSSLKKHHFHHYWSESHAFIRLVPFKPLEVTHQIHSIFVLAHGLLITHLRKF